MQPIASTSRLPRLLPVCHACCSARRSASSMSDFPYPSVANPSPFDLLHLPRDASGPQVRKRFREIAHIYHPDKQHQSGESRETCQERFRLIQEAYQLLSNSNRRAMYLRSGIGWQTPYLRDSIPFDQRHNPWGNARRYRPAHTRPRYPSGASDWTADGNTAFYDSYRYNRPEEKVSNRKTMTVLGIGSISLYLYHILGVVPSSSPGVQTNGSFASGSRNASPIILATADAERHLDAAKNLATARQEARLNAAERRHQVKQSSRLIKGRPTELPLSSAQ